MSGLGVAVVLAAVLDVPWWLSERYGTRTH
jgi:hypothetical protein